MLNRRQALVVGLLGPAGASLATDADAALALRNGGAVFAMRHALAPGTFDPPGFRLDECSTQRNLSDEGRAQARRIGAWFEARSLRPARVRSSPLCRCVDTATLAFGRAERWAALASPRGADDATSAARGREMRSALTAALAQRGRFEVWVTHGLVLSSLGVAGADSGEGVVLHADAGCEPVVIARLALS